MAKPKYSYIQFLPRNRIVIATTEALLGAKYIKGIFADNIYGYYRDDNGIETLPSLSVYHGRLNSPDYFDVITGNIIIDCYYGLAATRDDLTESVDTALDTLMLTLQNSQFHQNLTLAMFDYNYTKNRLQTQFDRNCFDEALKTRNPLRRYAFDYNVEQPTITTPGDIGDCFKIRVTYKYQLSLQGYYEFLELLGINGYFDPNKIVYPLFEEFYPDVEEYPNTPDGPENWILDVSKLDENTILS